MLNAGSIISRNIIGEDDWVGSTYFNNTINNLPDFSDGKGPTRGVQDGCNLECFSKVSSPTIWYYDMTTALDAHLYDFQPDQYYFNLPNGQSGKFVLKRDKTAVLQKQEELQITPNTDNFTWQIKDENGFIYDYAIFDSYRYYSNYSIEHKSAWYITKITSPAGNTVSFNYTQLPTTYITPVGSWSETRDDAQLPSTIGGNSVATLGNQSGWSTGKDYSTVLLSSIDYPSGKVQFYYSLPNRLDIANDRKLDSISIYTKDNQGNINANPLKTLLFGYEYFNGANDPSAQYGNTTNGYTTYRLKLKKVQEEGFQNGQAIQTPPYVFTYNEGTSNILPAKISFARDHWGYYNGKTSHVSLIPTYTPQNTTDPIAFSIGTEGNERDADPNYMQVFSLQSIQYPTGGSTEFQFESNTFDEQKSQVNDHSYFGNIYTIVKQYADLMYAYYSDGTGSWTSGGNVVNMSNEYVDPQTQTFGLTHLSVAYRFNSSGCNQIISGDNLITFNIINNETGQDMVGTKDIHLFYQCTGSSTNNCLLCNTSQGNVQSYNTDLSLPPGKYRVEMHVDPQYKGSLLDVHFDFSWDEEVNSNNTHGLTFSYGGGLRIKKIIDHNVFTPSQDKVTKFIYHHQEDVNKDGIPEELSYGRRMSKPQYSYFTKAIESYHFHSTASDYFVIENDYHLMRSSDSNVPLNGSAGGAVVGYDTVSVLYGENGENGKTVYCYQNSPDYVAGFNDDIYPLRPAFASNIQNLLNGSLLSQIDYWNDAGTFKKVKEITNQYTTSSIENIVYGIESRQTTIFNSESDGSSFTRDGTGTTPCGRTEISYQTLQSKWSYLYNTSVKTYDKNDDTKYVEAKTNYYYDNPKHKLLSRTETFNSKGEKITQYNTYPFDYTITGTTSDNTAAGILNLQNKHVITPVIEQYTQLSTIDQTNTEVNKRVTSSLFTSFKPTTTYPDIISRTENSSPLIDFTPAVISAAGTIKDGRYKAAIVFDSYDANGNLLQQHRNNDIQSAYLYDYKNEYPIAEVNNAQQSNIAYTSFEADGIGKWTFTNTSISSTQGFTGNKCYLLTSSNPIKRTNLPTTSGNNNYVVSFWAQTNTGIPTINGIAPTALAAKQGWTLYTCTVNNLTSGVITISGTATIDEVRLYPAGAQMTTYTYAPLIGMTSQCDAANHLTTYEYDGLGRLTLIRDGDGNIVKKIDYHYAGQAEPTTANCNCTDVSAGKKCINGQCEQGTRQNQGFLKMSDGTWRCTYKWNWSSGLPSGNQYEYNATPCFVN